jgi:hypothetical protein
MNHNTGIDHGSLRTTCSRDATTSFGRFLEGLLYRVGDLLDGLLCLPDRLIGFSFIAQLGVAGQRTGGFLDSTFRYVYLATHDGDSFS